MKKQKEKWDYQLILEGGDGRNLVKGFYKLKENGYIPCPESLQISNGFGENRNFAIIMKKFVLKEKK